jgi:hypothetical protein
MDLFILFDVVTVSPSEKKTLAPWLYYILTHRGFPCFFWFRFILKCIEPAVLVVPPRLKKSLMWFWCGPSRVMESSEPPVDKCAWLLVRCGGANDVLPPCVLFNTSVWKHVLASTLLTVSSNLQGALDATLSHPSQVTSMRCTLDQLAAQQLLVSAGSRHVLEALFVLRQHRCSQLGCDLRPEAWGLFRYPEGSCIALGIELLRMAGVGKSDVRA